MSGHGAALAPLARADWACAAGCAAVALAAYVCTLAPAVMGEDCGELAAAAYGLGVPHPPGYALWTIVAHGFTWLPWGTVAWRAALLSAVAGAGTVGGVALLVRMLGGGRIGMIAGALALAFSREFWEQAIVVEVYTLTALCMAAAIGCAFAWRARADGLLDTPHADRWLYAMALVCGMGTGAHYALFVVAALLGVYVLACDGVRPARFGAYARAALCFALGLSVHVYLPFASVRDPAIDWGDPETPARWWAVLARAQYAFMPGEHPRGALRFALQLRAMLAMLARDFTPWVLAMSAAGFAALLSPTPRAAHARTREAGLLLAIGAGTMAAFAWAQNFTYDAEWLQVMSVFNVPAAVCAAVALGAGVSWAAWRSRVLALLLAAIAVASPLLTHAAHNDQSRNRWVERHARGLLEGLPPDAILVADGDHDAFPARYLQAVEGVRRDVSIANVYGYADMTLWAAMPDAARYGAQPRGRFEPELYAWLVEHGTRPVYFARPPRWPAGADIRTVQDGVLWRALPADAPTPEGLPRPPAARAPRAEEAGAEYTLGLLRVQYAMAWAAWHAARSERAEALAQMRQAAAVFPGDPRMGNNLGVWAAREGFAEDAAALFRAALRTAESHLPGDPAIEALRNNLARLGGRPGAP